MKYIENKQLNNSRLCFSYLISNVKIYNQLIFFITYAKLRKTMLRQRCLKLCFKISLLYQKNIILTALSDIFCQKNWLSVFISIETYCNLLCISYIGATTQRNYIDHYPLIMEQDSKQDSKGQELFAVATITKIKCSNSLLFKPKIMFRSDHIQFPYQELWKLLDKLQQSFLNKTAFHSQEKSVQEQQIKFYIKVYIYDSYVITLVFWICSSLVIFGSLLHSIKVTCNPNLSDFTISIKFIPGKEIIPSEEGDKKRFVQEI